ncbi:CPBP family intramembrane metalloprotease [bacterium]|nr:CPBP family intramembrane metalloprotease [bacterium]
MTEHEPQEREDPVQDQEHAVQDQEHAAQEQGDGALNDRSSLQGPGGVMQTGMPGGIAVSSGMHPVFFGFLVLIIVFVSYQLLGGIISFLLFGLGSEENVQGMRLVTMFSQFLFLLVPSVLLLKLMRWDWRQALRLNMPRIGPLLLVVVGVVSLQFVVQAYMEAQQFVLRNYLLPESMLTLLDKFENLIEELYGTLLGMHSPGEALFVWLVIAVTPAICEEVLFRGTVLWSFEKGMRLRWAFLLNGAIFSMFHLNPITFVPLALLGTYFAVITWRGSSLVYAMTGHVVNNSIAVLALYLFDADSLLPAETAGNTPSAAMLAVTGVIALAVFIASLVLFWQLTAHRDREYPRPS